MQKMRATLQKKVDSEDPTSLLDQVCLGCPQRPAQVNNRLVVEKQNLFSKLISTYTDVRTEEKNPKDITAWSYDIEGHAQKCVVRYCHLTHKTVDKLHKVPTLRLDDHQVKPGDLKIVKVFSEICSQIALTCLYLARIGKADLLWTKNCLAISVTQWNRECDSQPGRLISYIHHTSNNRQFCHAGKQATDCKLGLFQDADFAGNLSGSESTSGGAVCIFVSHTFVPITWACKQQTPESHSSKDAEIVSLDAGLRMEGIPWIYCIPKLEMTPSLFIKHKYQSIMIHLETQITYIRTRDNSACERPPRLRRSDKNRDWRPAMRHTSRTHWVDLDIGCMTASI